MDMRPRNELALGLLVIGASWWLSTRANPPRTDTDVAQQPEEDRGPPAQTRLDLPTPDARVQPVLNAHPISVGRPEPNRNQMVANVRFAADIPRARAANDANAAAAKAAFSEPEPFWPARAVIPADVHAELQKREQFGEHHWAAATNADNALGDNPSSLDTWTCRCGRAQCGGGHASDSKIAVVRGRAGEVDHGLRFDQVEQRRGLQKTSGWNCERDASDIYTGTHFEAGFGNVNLDGGY